MSNNDSDWLDDFIIMSIMEEDEKEEEASSESVSFPKAESPHQEHLLPRARLAVVVVQVF